MNKRRKLSKLLLMLKLPKTELKERSKKLRLMRRRKKQRLKLKEKKRLHFKNKELLLLRPLPKLLLLIKENWNPELMLPQKQELPWPRNIKQNCKNK